MTASSAREKLMTFVERCETCVFWKREPYNGQCRRHAPLKPTAPWKDDFGVVRDNIWPLTRADDFCGDWELRDAQ